MNNKNLSFIIVDDEPVNLMLLEEIAKENGYEPLTFSSPLDALKYAENNHIDLIITDFNMPKMDGLELLYHIKAIYPEILSIMITANDDRDIKLKALDYGVSDFLTKPVFPGEFKLRLRNIIGVLHSIKLEKEFSNQLKREVLAATSALRESQFETLRVLSKAAEYKDPETSSHIARVAYYSKMLGELLGMDEHEQELLYFGAPLHDIGKIGIDDSILLKPGKLSDEEFDQMKKHPWIGAEILSGADNLYLQAGAIIAQSHHEKFDGSGYPGGLCGEDIPLYGRIVAIADVFDALTSHRPYKKAWSFERAMILIEEEKGRHFDPKIAELFIQNIERVREIFSRFEHESGMVE